MRLIGDVTHYQLTGSIHGKQRLICSLAYSTGVPRPREALWGNYLTIWRATNGVGFCARPGFRVVNAAIRHDMTLAEFCAEYSDMHESIVAAIKASENSHT